MCTLLSLSLHEYMFPSVQVARVVWQPLSPFPDCLMVLNFHDHHADMLWRRIVHCNSIAISIGV